MISEHSLYIESQQQLRIRSHITGSQMLLRLPDRCQKHPQQDILTPHRHECQGPYEEDAPPASNQDRPMCPAESTVGAQMVRLHCSQLCQTYNRVCRARGYILFRLLLCHLLVETAWPDAGALLQY